MQDNSTRKIEGTLVRFRLIRRFPQGAPIIIGTLLVSGIAALDWITGPDGQRAIAAYQIDGEQPFHPSAEGRQ